MFHFSRIFHEMTLYRISKCYYGTQSKKKTHYEVLGVGENSTKKEIRLAFLKLSKQMHPDTGNKDGHTEFIKINDAYNILSKEDSRRKYDLDLKYEKNLHHSSIHKENQKSYVYHKRTSSARAQESTRKTHPGVPPKGPQYFDEKFHGPHPLKHHLKIKMIFSFITIIFFGLSLQYVALVSRPISPKKEREERKLAEYIEEMNRIREESKKKPSEGRITNFYQKAVEHAERNEKK